LVLNRCARPAAIFISSIRKPGRLVTVPNHPEIATGTLLSILKQANIEKEEFLKHVK
jgi:hypothetical protein